jgi:hypothetical protein
MWHYKAAIHQPGYCWISFICIKGQSSLETLSLINPSATEILHLNDYPANLAAADITDADRIYSGEGIAPIKRVLQLLKNPHKPLILSLELFNKNYYQQDALAVAKTGLAKMKAVTKAV